jgi:hypothetical protein
VFVEAVLALPGVLVGLPVIIAGVVWDINWLTEGGLVLGATFFWYCAGWYADCSRGMVNSEKPPRVVASTVIFPIMTLAGWNVGQHYCANGTPPLWSELLMYGIGMSWVTFGTFFGLRRFRRWREQKRSPSVFRI